MKFKPFLFCFSLFLNVLFISLFAAASFSKRTSLFYRSPPDGYVTAAALVSLPSSGKALFGEISIALTAGDVCYLQYAVASLKNQGSLVINALYDPSVIRVTQTGYGLEITALQEGETLMQSLTNEGVRNVALITVASK